MKLVPQLCFVVHTVNGESAAGSIP